MYSKAVLFCVCVFFFRSFTFLVIIRYCVYLKAFPENKCTAGICLYFNTWQTLPTMVGIVKAMGFPVVWMWEQDNKEGRALKNWCFQTVMLEKTLENTLESKEIKPVNLKGNQSWILFGRTDACASQRRVALLTTTRESLNTTMKTQQNQKNKSIKILKIV